MVVADRIDTPATEGDHIDGTIASLGFSESMKETVTAAIAHFARRARAIDRSPRVLIDGHCNILWRSAHAERILRRPLPLWIEGGRLHAKGGSGGRSWASLVERIGEDGERLLLTGQDGGSWVLLRAWAEWHGQHRLIYIKCTTSCPLRDVASSGMAKDFGLTKSECAVLDSFAHLKKPEQIAEQLNIAVSTVRSHLKQIHTKMSVNSSIQLLRITRAYTDS